MKRSKPSNAKKIQHTSKIRVRFAECDPLGIVWHGNYIQYFEDGRESFGNELGIGYLNQKEHNFSSPIVKSLCEHKLPLKYGDIAIIETTYIDCDAAKMIFQYKIFTPEGLLACTGETTQVFVALGGELSLTFPDFMVRWKQKMGLLDE
ncbi:4-hydroxybenzoyl-CoA thioesterase [Patiriisocius marinistellae]|uniref:4-hydroxybenzoyl-CoA thioesterase n=1 Tax=Patiriisocius marinistellae TaxID=2494560 RepID=A0A5J4FZS5_9FLAO|nr:acyl-CoA thioesterase [Patiriisocius marinistellae]GEQ85231.1 4-hydroxybenzoyl-CoA thioesterase [Patiriisocius marinistellae]